VSRERRKPQPQAARCASSEIAAGAASRDPSRVSQQPICSYHLAESAGHGSERGRLRGRADDRFRLGAGTQPDIAMTTSREGRVCTARVPGCKYLAEPAVDTASNAAFGSREDRGFDRRPERTSCPE
jgi:hypothetical protein